MDLTCSICLNVLFKPVHLPCNHQFCKDCIVQALNFTAYQCPICRYRLSNWLRRVKDIDSVISESKENEIRSLFPNYYDAKESGMSPSLSEFEIKTLAAKNTGVVGFLFKNSTLMFVNICVRRFICCFLEEVKVTSL